MNALKSLAVLAAAVVMLAGTAFAEPRKIEDFYGEFIGEGATLTDIGETPSPNDRAANVVISPEGSGFKVEWTTMRTREPVSEAQRSTVKWAELTFGAADAKGVWYEMSNEGMGGGKPFIWARIDDDTLVITTVILREDGSYDLTSYERKLKSKDDMELTFTRFRDGEIVRRAKADLKRQ